MTLMWVHALSLTVTLTSVQTPDIFKDVPATNWPYGAIRQLWKSGLAKPYPADHFNGQRLLTRYEFAAVTEYALSDLWEEAWLTEPHFELRVLNQVEQLDPATATALLQLIDEFQEEMVTVGKSVRGVRKHASGPITLSSWYGSPDRLKYVDYDGLIKYREIPYFGPLQMKRRGRGLFSGIF
jgi:hypothetical protein